MPEWSERLSYIVIEILCSISGHHTAQLTAIVREIKSQYNDPLRASEMIFSSTNFVFSTTLRHSRQWIKLDIRA